MKYVLIRHPSTMEDGGRYEHHGTYTTKSSLLAALNHATNNDTGYYRYTDFYWAPLHSCRELEE